MDENSPFNECAHAYLAAGRALLLQLAHEPGADHKAIDALISKIEFEMLADGASMNLCRYSDEPFNTNEVIWPHWSMVPFHPPTAMLAAVGFFAIAAALWGARPRRGASPVQHGTSAEGAVVIFGLDRSCSGSDRGKAISILRCHWWVRGAERPRDPETRPGKLSFTKRWL